MPRTINHTDPAVQSGATLPRSFTALSRRLNELGEEQNILREAVESTLSILDAPAGLVMLQRPIDVMYSRFLHHSTAIGHVETTLRDQREYILSALTGQRKSMIEKDGALLIPLSWQTRLIGVFAIDKSPKTLPPHHRAGLLSVCNQLAAIFGVKYALGGKQEVTPFPQDELEKAVAVQNSLLPTVPVQTCGLEIAAHSRPAAYVGGDYYDLITVDRNKLGIVIADVEGKGVSGALFGNLLRSTVHFLTRELLSTSEVVEKINTILHKEAHASRKLFTLFYAVYDATKRRLMFTGSGHVAPVVVRARDAGVERLSSEGTVLGINTVQRYTQRSIQLGPADIVAFYTDGITDQRDGRGTPFGEDRLITLLRDARHLNVNDIVRSIVDEHTRFTGTSCEDDVTLLVIKGT